MSTDADQYSTGVYLITNTTTNTVYVGSTTQSFYRRRWSHLNRLKRGKHGNTHLQRAWRKYGADAFVFSIIEVITDRALIVVREQYWIDYYLSLPTGACYNMLPTAYSGAGKIVSPETRRKMSMASRGRVVSLDARVNLSRARRGAHTKCVDLLSPDGIEYRDIDNMAAFCREHRLSKRHVHGIASGQKLSYKGWTAINTDRSRLATNTFAFLSPAGTEYLDIRSLTAFCKEHQLNVAAMSDVYAQNAPHHRGWRCIDSAFQPKYAFISPDGIVYRDIVKLAPFCREHKLNPVSMSLVHTGRWKQYKDWKKAPD